MTSHRRRSRPPRTGLPVGIAAAVAGIALLMTPVLPWLRTATDRGGVTSVGGLGAVSGDSSLAGGNLNDVIAGFGSFRPGLIGLLIGAVAVLSGAVLALVRPVRPRPFRVSAVVLTALGVTAVGWGAYRWIDPDPAGVLGDGRAMSGAGSWLTVAGGLLLLGVSVRLWQGRVDPRPEERIRHRGIQPRN